MPIQIIPHKVTIAESEEQVVDHAINSDIPNAPSYNSLNIKRNHNTPGLTPIGLYPPAVSSSGNQSKYTTEDQNKDIVEDVTMLRALDLRARGKTIYDISKTLGASVGQVTKMLELALTAISNGNVQRAEQVRELENYRLDRMLDRLWPLVDPPNPNADPDLQAVDRVLRIMERRAKMYGSDALPQAEAADGITQSISFTQIIAANPESIALSHQLLAIASGSIPASLTSGTSVPVDEGQVQDSQTHTTSIFDLDDGDGGDLSVSSGGDAAETREN